jgi:hypothetical protein
MKTKQLNTLFADCFKNNEKLFCSHLGCNNHRLPGLNNFCYKHTLDFLMKIDPERVSSFKKRYATYKKH